MFSNQLKHPDPDFVPDINISDFFSVSLIVKTTYLIRAV